MGNIRIFNTNLLKTNVFSSAAASSERAETRRGCRLLPVLFMPQKGCRFRVL